MLVGSLVEFLKLLPNLQIFLAVIISQEQVGCLQNSV